MKILFIDHVGEIGGAEKSLIDLVSQLSQHNNQCVVVVPARGRLYHVLNEMGCSVYVQELDSWRWWRRGHFGDFIKLIFSFPKQVMTIYKYYLLIKRIRPEIIHFNINRLVEPVIAARFHAIPTVMHFRDIPSTVTRKFFGGVRVFYWMMNLADYWIANSEATYKQISSYRAERVKMIYNGIDPTKLVNKAEKFDKKINDVFTVVMIAGLSHRKNIEAFINLAFALRGQPESIKFWLVGSGPPNYADELQRKVYDYGIEDFFSFLGHIDNVGDPLSKADLLVHTTLDESFGRVFVEAMLVGKPVVAFKGGAADEIIVNGQTGFLAKKNDLNEMSNYIIQLMRDKKMMLDFGLSGKRRAEKLFTLERHGEKVINLYNEILDR